jgi:small GTP-binding protein
MSEEGENINCVDAKVVLVGESGVGKTSIIKQFTSHKFDPDCAASISSQFSSKVVNISDSKKAIRFDLWDTAGQEKYRSLAKIFYKDARIIIFVYEITNKKSFEGIQNYWYQQVNANRLPKVVFAVVGNKSDLYNNSEVDEKEASDWADSIGAIFQTTSALSNIGIDVLFDNVGKKFLNPDYNYRKDEDKKKQAYEMKKEKQNKNEEEEDEDIKLPEIQNIKLNANTNNEKNKKKKCC